MFVTAEGRSGIEHIVGIDPDYAGFNLFRETMRASDIRGPDAGGETVDSFVSLLDQVVLILKRNHRDDRAEDFLLGDTHLDLYVREDRRLADITLLGKPSERQTFATRHCR